MNTHSPDLCLVSLATIFFIWAVTTRLFTDFFKKDYWQDRFTRLFNLTFLIILAINTVAAIIMHAK